MYFDDYSTSFQSLYSPMYNLQTNNAAMGGRMNGGAAGYGMGMGMGMGGYPMGVYNGSMTNIAVGQFGADQLVKNDEARNNYYARPIAAHKKKDELPTILGIIGTALGTAALLLALRKGKKAPSTVNPVTPGVVNPVPPAVVNPTPINKTVKVRQFVKPPYNTPVYNVDPSTLRYAPGAKAPSAPIGGGAGTTSTTSNTVSVRRFTNPPFSSPVYNVDPSTLRYAPGAKAPSSPIGGGAGTTGAGATGTGSASGVNSGVTITGLPTHHKPSGSWKDSAVDTPYEAIGQKLLGSKPSVPQRLVGVKSQNLLGAPVQTLGLPAPGNGGLPVVANNRPNLKPINDYLPKQDMFTTVPQSGANIKGQLPSLPYGGNNVPVMNPVKTAENNLFAVRPEMKNAGNVVYTTHTPETIAQGYSLGSNAKGADKLAALLAQMQG